MTAEAVSRELAVEVRAWDSPHDFRRLREEVALTGKFFQDCSALINLLAQIEQLPERVRQKFIYGGDDAPRIRPEILSEVLLGRDLHEVEELSEVQSLELVRVSFEVIELSFASPLKLSTRVGLTIVTALGAVTPFLRAATDLMRDLSYGSHGAEPSPIVVNYYPSTPAEQYQSILTSNCMRTMETGGLSAVQTYLKQLGYYHGKIDGKDGKLTHQAIHDISIRYDLPEGRWDDPNVQRAIAKAVAQTSHF